MFITYMTTFNCALLLQQQYIIRIQAQHAVQSRWMS